VTQFFNKSTEKAKRRRLRSDSPTAENTIWTSLRRKNIAGYKFRRQYSVGPYVIDFYCPALKLAVEIDGDSHFIGNAVEDDKRRQALSKLSAYVSCDLPTRTFTTTWRES